MLVDLWEAAPGGAPVAKASGPVNLTAAGPHKLELTFSTTKLEAAVLVLQWAPCSAPADAAALTSTAGIDSSAVWQPEQLMTGWLGGVQCDVWQSDAINQLVPPSYKFRLPDCPGPWHQASDSCQLPLIGTLGEMLPGLGEAQPGSRFSVRCWSYSSREFHGPLVAGPEDVHSRVWLAGAEVRCVLWCCVLWCCVLWCCVLCAVVLRCAVCCRGDGVAGTRVLRWIMSIIMICKDAWCPALALS
jgi:hypothetical protein